MRRNSIVGTVALLAFSMRASALLAAPRPRAADVVTLRGTGSDGAHLSLTLPVNLLAQLQQPGGNASVNLTQVGGASVAGTLYDSANTALKVNCVVGCSATAGFSDNSAFTAGSTVVNNVSGVFNDGIAALTSGNAGAIRATSDRMLYVNIGKIAGTAPTLTGSSLNVNCTGGCGGAATFADNSAFTAGASGITNVGGVFNDALAAVTSGNAAAPRITSSRAFHVNLRNNSGTEIGTAAAPVRVDPTGTSIQPVSGTVTSNIGTTGGLALDASVAGLQVAQGSTTSGQKGELIQGAVTTSAPTYTTGQTSPLSLTTAGGLRVDGSGVTQPVSGTITANQGTANATPWNENLAQLGGTAIVNGGVAGTLGVGGTTAAGSAVGGNPQQIAGNASGNVTRAIFCDNWTKINQTAGAQLIIGAASKQTYICNLFLFSATAQNVALVEGTGTVCATGTAGMLGGATAATGQNFAANQGFVLPASTVPWAKTATAADNVCLLQSGTGQVSGVIVWTQF